MSTSKELLEKVYNHLDSVDLNKLSMRDMEDFVGVVQKCQFLEYSLQSSGGLGGLFGSSFGFGGNGKQGPIDGAIYCEGKQEELVN